MAKDYFEKLETLVERIIGVLVAHKARLDARVDARIEAKIDHLVAQRKEH